MKFDLWKHLDDPIDTNQCLHEKDNNESMTLLAVMSQPKFADVCVRNCEYVEKTDKRSHILVLECNSGYHRASTTSENVQAMLNGMYDKNGNRRYNAQLYPLYSYTNGPTIQAELAEAIKWARLELEGIAEVKT